MCTWNSRHYCGKILSFVLTSWFANSVDAQSISAQEGFTVILPCEFNITSDQRLYIRWVSDKGVVFKRLGMESCQGERYEGRVDVPEHELRKGNCSLVLKNVSVTDAGNYTTRLNKFIQSVELSVEVNKEAPKKQSVTDDAGLNSPHPLAMVLSLIFTLYGFGRD